MRFSKCSRSLLNRGDLSSCERKVKCKRWEESQRTTDSSFQGKPSCTDVFNDTFVLLITELTKQFKLHLQFRKYASIIRIVL